MIVAALISVPFRYHWLPVAALDASTTLWPEQNASAVTGVITGVAGNGLMVILLFIMVKLCVTAFVAVHRIDPPVLFPALLLNLINNGVLLTVPLFCVTLILLLYAPPEVAANSKPVGAVIVILEIKLLPLTLKDCGVDAMPEQVLKELSVPVIVVTGGGGLTVTVNVLLLDTQPVILFFTVNEKL